jgi:hypothetical protein
VAAGPAPPSTASRVSRLVRLGRRFVAPDGGARHHWSGGREDECTRLESGRPVTGFVGSNPTRSAHLVGTVHSRSWLTGLAWADPHQRLPHRRGRRPAPSNYQGHDAVAAWQHATRPPRGRDRSSRHDRTDRTTSDLSDAVPGRRRRRRGSLGLLADVVEVGRRDIRCLDGLPFPTPSTCWPRRGRDRRVSRPDRPTLSIHSR